jgi:hypothetical protein
MSAGEAKAAYRLAYLLFLIVVLAHIVVILAVYEAILVLL